MCGHVVIVGVAFEYLIILYLIDLVRRKVLIVL